MPSITEGGRVVRCRHLPSGAVPSAQPTSANCPFILATLTQVCLPRRHRERAHRPEGMSSGDLWTPRGRVMEEQECSMKEQLSSFSAKISSLFPIPHSCRRHTSLTCDALVWGVCTWASSGIFCVSEVFRWQLPLLGPTVFPTGWDRPPFPVFSTQLPRGPPTAPQR
ncbi:hypothetical protein Cadr_000001399 [Camelus dromedarius]|uniref:Uncharacterized protein n=1 Tax=Camelus dromedarius TaxID=9838 RepID=A0A5N4EF44_CAMDR|nr:hypothetical protein Cadr_000001399 [Camelus dromedarius]